MEITRAGECRFLVSRDDRSLGWVEEKINPFHRQNCRLELHLDELDPGFAPMLFEKLAAMIGRPLQIMVESEDRGLVDFIRAGGFALRRRCFEREVTAEQCRHPLVGYAAPLRAAPPSEKYAACCRLLYRRYTQTHRAVNPLTADEEDFCADLPRAVFYRQQGGEISQFAFVEGNEIAYVGSAHGADKEFLLAVLADLFRRHEAVEFEADDRDRDAMLLKALFGDEEDSSYDTYVRE